MILFRNLINPLALHDRIFRYGFLVVAPFINLLSFALVFWKIFPIRGARDVFALHYNIYFGIDLIGEWYKIFAVPLAALLFLILNFIFASLSYRASRALAYFATGFTVLAELILFLALFLIILLNI